MRTVSEFHILIEGFACSSVALQDDMQPFEASCLQSGVLHDLGELVKDSPKAGFLKLLLERRASSSPAWLYLTAKGDEGAVSPKSQHLLGIDPRMGKKEHYPASCT